MLKTTYDNKIEAGCDEAGRGSLAGPVIASAVILPKNFNHRFLNDSKKLTEKKRIKMENIIKKNAICWSIGEVGNQEIDEINILNASIKAMHLAINKLNETPQIILIDGNHFHKYKKIEHKCIIKGDTKYSSIAAASILAKNYRDRLMKKLHVEFPQFNWDKNKGYPTKFHRHSIVKNGPSRYHRRTFKPLNL